VLEQQRLGSGVEVQWRNVRAGDAPDVRRETGLLEQRLQYELHGQR